MLVASIPYVASAAVVSITISSALLVS